MTGARSRCGGATARECSEQFPGLAAIAEALGKRRATLDGELVCLREDGRPDFVPLRRRLAGRARNPRPVMLQIFDVLHLDGCSTRTRLYRERRALLGELALGGPAWRTPSRIMVNRGEDFVARVAALGLEGVVANRLTPDTSRGERSTAWIKHKLRGSRGQNRGGVRRPPVCPTARSGRFCACPDSAGRRPRERPG
jgi:bifunctional non-homologous end joining protein LigD